MRRPVAHALVTLTLVCLVAAPVGAGEPHGRNLLFSIALVETTPDGQVTRHLSRIQSLDGKQSHLSSGWKVPIPVSTSGGEGAAGAVTELSYQEVGFLAWIEGRIGEDGVRARGRVEVSSVERDVGTGTAPTIGSFSQKFDILLAVGEPITLAEAPRSGGGTRSLTLAVEMPR